RLSFPRRRESSVPAGHRPKTLDPGLRRGDEVWSSIPSWCSPLVVDGHVAALGTADDVDPVMRRRVVAAPGRAVFRLRVAAGEVAQADAGVGRIVGAAGACR